MLFFIFYRVCGHAVACLCRAVGRCARVCPLKGVRVYMGRVGVVCALRPGRHVGGMYMCLCRGMSVDTSIGPES